MTSNAEVQAKDIHKENLEWRERVWNDLEKQMSKEHAQEFQKIRTRAQSLIEEMHVMLQTPDAGGADGLVVLAERLNEEWERAQILLAKVHDDRIGSSFGKESLREAETVLLNDLDIIRDQDLTQEETNIVEELERIDTVLLVSAEDALLDQKLDSFYTRNHTSGLLIVDPRKAQKAQNFLQDVVKNAGVRRINTKIVNHACAVNKAIQNLRGVNMEQLQKNQWYEENFGQRHKGDMKPLRYALAAVGIPITALGLWNIVRGKGFSLATPFWALITAFSIKPDLLKGKAAGSIERLKQFDSSDLRYLLCRGFRGERGVKAYEELQDVHQSKDKELLSLLAEMKTKNFEIDATHIAALTGKNSSLYKIMEPWSKEDRKKAILLFGKKRNETDTALWTEYIRGSEK